MPRSLATTMKAACVRCRISSAIGSITRSGCGSANAFRTTGIDAIERAIASDCCPSSWSICRRVCHSDTAKPALTVSTMIATCSRRIWVESGRSLRQRREPVTTGW